LRIVLVVGAHGVTAFQADADESQRRRFDDFSRAKPNVEGRRFKRSTAQEQARRERPRRERQSVVWLRTDDASLLDLSAPVRYELRPVR